MVKTYTWYLWTGHDNKIALTFYTSIYSEEYAVGFRFIEEDDGWKFHEYSYNANPEWNKEVDMRRYDFPREWLRYIMVRPFIDIGDFE